MAEEPDLDLLVKKVHLLRPNAALWVNERIGRFGDTPVAHLAANPLGLRCTLPGPHSKHGETCFSQDGRHYLRFPDIGTGVQVGLVVAQRATPNHHLPPITEPIVGWVPGFGPNDNAIKTVLLLRADLSAFEREGIGSTIAKEMRPAMEDLRTFLQQWEKCTDNIFGCEIDSTDIGGKLRGAVLDSNRIRSILRDLGRPGYPKSDDRHSGDVADATTFAHEVANPVANATEALPKPLQDLLGGNIKDAIAALKSAGLWSVGIGAPLAVLTLFVAVKSGFLPVPHHTSRAEP